MANKCWMFRFIITPLRRVAWVSAAGLVRMCAVYLKFRHMWGTSARVCLEVTNKKLKSSCILESETMPPILSVG
jgi:hypothetical protein